MNDPPEQPAPDERAEPSPSTPQRDEEAALAGLLRAFKRFLIPFLASWAIAYLGSNLQLEWLYFAGLGGVAVSMLVFLVWLIS